MCSCQKPGFRKAYKCVPNFRNTGSLTNKELTPRVKPPLECSDLCEPTFYCWNTSSSTSAQPNLLVYRLGAPLP